MVFYSVLITHSKMDWNIDMEHLPILLVKSEYYFLLWSKSESFCCKILFYEISVEAEVAVV